MCREISEDESIKVVIVTGAGSAFCAGADIAGAGGHPAINDYVGDEPIREVLKGWSYERLVKPVGYEIFDIWNCIKPTIAMVNGVTAGAGMSIAAACDIRITSDNARFGLRFHAVGLIPDACGTYLIPRLIGYDKAFELYCSDSVIDAQEALRIGLVTKVVPDNQLVETTMNLAEKIAKGPSLAQILTKRGMREGLHNTFRTQLDYESYAQNYVRTTSDFKNAVLAFRDKQKPKFTGR